MKIKHQKKHRISKKNLPENGFLLRLLLIGSYFVFFLSILQGQTIQNIVFQGNKKTKNTYLSRFLETKSGQKLEVHQLEQDIQRLKNLNSIANATYRVDTLENSLKIVFELEEALTFFPIVNFGGVKGNFWFQLGFTDVNWLGNGTQLTAYYQNNDRRNNFSLYYRVPYWKGGRWGSSISLLRWASIEPLYFDQGAVFYDYTNTSVGATGIYEINRNQNIEIGATYFIENYKKNNRHEGQLTPGPEGLEQPKILGKLIHQINRIDYHFYYQSGFNNITNFQTVFNFNERSWFQILMNDTRYFKRLRQKGNLGIRLRLGISTNNNTPFAPFVLDSYVNIRGSGNRIDRGTAAIILNLEYRHTFFDKNQFAGQFVAFSDSGTWRSPGGSFSDLGDSNNFRHFLGGGVRFIYKKAFNAILRLDYGIDIYDFDQRGVVIGIGQYF